MTVWRMCLKFDSLSAKFQHLDTVPLVAQSLILVLLAAINTAKIHHCGGVPCCALTAKVTTDAGE